MKSETNGSNTSTLEVTNISQHGLWLLVGDKEYFLDYKQFPWFRTATVEQILDVQWEGQTVIRWPKLDIDLNEDILAHPQRFPLTAKG